MHAVRNDQQCVLLGLNTLSVMNMHSNGNDQQGPLGSLLVLAFPISPHGVQGVGLGFAVAAAAVAHSSNPQQLVVAVEGDSAFGFSGMELETLVRYARQETTQHLDFGTWNSAPWFC
eukprot:1141056-Pelagomonas_calceolata.AAC.1